MSIKYSNKINKIRTFALALIFIGIVIMYIGIFFSDLRMPVMSIFMILGFLTVFIQAHWSTHRLVCCRPAPFRSFVRLAIKSQKCLAALMLACIAENRSRLTLNLKAKNSMKNITAKKDLLIK